MELLVPLLASVVGAALGAAAVALVVRGRRGQQQEIWEERLASRERQGEELRQALAAARSLESEQRAMLREEAARRATAEERASRVPALEEALAGKEQAITALQGEVADLRSEQSRLATRLEEERKSLQQQLHALGEARQNLAETFQSLSAEALRQSNQSFLELARATFANLQTEAKGELEQRQKAVQHLVEPIRQSLEKVDLQIRELEKARQSAYGSITQQVMSLTQTQERLQGETARLVQALRAPHVRGRWGEIQLRRVVEIAGMLSYCDFVEQPTMGPGDGRLRPDLVVRLPGEKSVVVDSKAPLKAYLDSLEAPHEEGRKALLADHSRQLRDHLGRLSSKAYWEQLDHTPEFVVMFLPGESFFSAALEHDPSLIEEGVHQGVILATPTTLIALLRAVFYGWRQERLADSARAISALGKDLYDRLRVLGEHVEKVGIHLGRAVGSYNDAVGSLERRVLVAARRFTELGVAAPKEIPELVPVDLAPRALQPTHWEGADEEDGPPPLAGPEPSTVAEPPDRDDAP